MSRTAIPKDDPGAEKIHPHAQATYRVFPLGNGAFGIEVNIPETNPTKVSMFKTEADAEEWIAEHKRRVQSNAQLGRRFRGRGAR